MPAGLSCQICRSGRRSTKPSSAGVILIWQDNRLFGSRSVAVPSSRSSSSAATGASFGSQASSTASSDLTGKACSPNTIQWVNDAWATGNTTAAAMMARGGKDWYFVTVNFALGQGIEAEATSYIEKHGGKVVGSSKHPLGTSDFASFLLQAQNSKAKVIGLANAGGDTINAVKQAAEFGIQQGGQTMVAFLLFVNDVHGMGLKVAQGLQLLEAFYWDMNDDTRAFAKRFAARPGMNGKMPSEFVAMARGIADAAKIVAGKS